MKIFVLLNFFSAYLLADSVNFEVSDIFLLHAVSLCFQFALYVEFLSMNTLAYSIDMLTNLMMNKYILIFSYYCCQHNAGQFFSSAHTNNWAVLVSIYLCHMVKSMC